VWASAKDGEHKVCEMLLQVVCVCERERAREEETERVLLATTLAEAQEIRLSTHKSV